MRDWDFESSGTMSAERQPFDRLVFQKHGGISFSLHRYAGRWIILRAAREWDPPALLDADVRGLDAVMLNVVTGPVIPLSDGDEGVGEIVFDTHHRIESRFPSLDWPATFVLDPEGRLVAILSDTALPIFLSDLVRSQRTTFSSGAIDRRDIQS